MSEKSRSTKRGNMGNTGEIKGNKEVIQKNTGIISSNVVSKMRSFKDKQKRFNIN
jgi:hypothetical protein